MNQQNSLIFSNLLYIVLLNEWYGETPDNFKILLISLIELFYYLCIKIFWQHFGIFASTGSTCSRTCKISSSPCCITYVIRRMTLEVSKFISKQSFIKKIALFQLASCRKVFILLLIFSFIIK